MFLAKWGLHQELSGIFFTMVTDLNEILKLCQIEWLKVLSKNIHNLLFGRRKLTKTLFHDLFDHFMTGSVRGGGKIFARGGKPGKCCPGGASARFAPPCGRPW